MAHGWPLLAKYIHCVIMALFSLSLPSIDTGYIYTRIPLILQDTFTLPPLEVVVTKQSLSYGYHGNGAVIGCPWRIGAA